ncbi:MAG: hypothetical protein JRI52_10270, partial [Deltaproteobacteria bacterium]|nr:hypothetical protein [Deltaproteobacteria bacterium]
KYNIGERAVYEYEQQNFAFKSGKTTSMKSGIIEGVILSQDKKRFLYKLVDENFWFNEGQFVNIKGVNNV